MHYYKRHIGDYAKKTAHLSTWEHGAYNLILDAYYDREQAPTTKEALRWTMARTDQETQWVMQLLDEYFQLLNGRWQQLRVEAEFVNAQAVADKNRANGMLGGRPRKRVSGSKTQSDSIGLPNETQTKGNPLIHQSTNPSVDQKKKKAPAHADVDFGNVDEAVIRDFKALRTKLRAPITETVIKGMQREADKAGFTLESAMTMCCERSWRGFKAEWVLPTQNGQKPSIAQQFSEKSYTGTPDNELPEWLRDSSAT